jgi:hypothetical protein
MMLQLLKSHHRLVAFAFKGKHQPAGVKLGANTGSGLAQGRPAFVDLLSSQAEQHLARDLHAESSGEREREPAVPVLLI